MVVIFARVGLARIIIIKNVIIMMRYDNNNNNNIIMWATRWCGWTRISIFYSPWNHIIIIMYTHIIQVYNKNPSNRFLTRRTSSFMCVRIIVILHTMTFILDILDLYRFKRSRLRWLLFNRTKTLCVHAKLYCTRHTGRFVEHRWLLQLNNILYILLHAVTF